MHFKKELDIQLVQELDIELVQPKHSVMPKKSLMQGTKGEDMGIYNYGRNKKAKYGRFVNL